jgi:predicted metal-dependent hydrolase
VNLDGYRRGILLFNREAFFDAHEVWEDVWREADGLEKKFLQGLIQVAVAFHHYSNGNIAGARSLLERGCKNLAECPEEFAGISVAGLLGVLVEWRETLVLGGPKPAFPNLGHH